jgi:hypothetical protein
MVAALRELGGGNERFFAVAATARPEKRGKGQSEIDGLPAAQLLVVECGVFQSIVKIGKILLAGKEEGAA